MKKSILTTIIACVIGINSFGQREELKLGIKAGPSISNVFDSEGEQFEADPKLGYTIGANLEIPIGKFLGVHPEVLLTQKGFQGRGAILTNEYKYSKTTTFLEVPVLFAFKPFDAVSIVAGPQFAYLLSEKNEFESGTTEFNHENTFEQDNIRKNIMGLVGGININIDHITIGGRVGFDLQNNRGDGTHDTPRYKNTWAQLTLGYRFY
ncbi:porin family protein [Brumimicrobium aurantiacum]|nr:porin family protein [Brumimicrobium aurantiacum]